MNEDAFIGEIRPFTYSFAPDGWEFCNGQRVPIQSNAALFSIIGTRFGGDGTSYFNLPNIQGAVLVGSGELLAGGKHLLGETGGSETEPLAPANMPPHTHTFNVSISNLPIGITTKEVKVPTSKCYLSNLYEEVGTTTGAKTGQFYTANTPDTALADETLSPFTGGTTPHSNMQPYLAISYCICVTDGDYPQQP